MTKAVAHHGGYLALDATGCTTKLAGNSLVQSLDLFQAAGFATALVDAPSDYRGGDGLGGFRLSAQHAEDIGKVIGKDGRFAHVDPGPIVDIAALRSAIAAAAHSPP